MTTPDNTQIDPNQQQQNNSQQPVNEQVKEEAPKSSAQWDAFRQARSVERKAAEEIARQAEKSAQEATALRAALESALNRQQYVRQGYGDDEREETEDQRFEKKISEALAKKEAEYEKQRREREQQEFPTRLTNTFGDFNQVCSTENIDYLEYHYPEVAQAFKYAPEGFDKWAAVYKAVKKLVPNTDSKKEIAKAEKNLNKPQSMSVSAPNGGGQSTPANRIDEKRKADNWARMQKAIKGVRD